MAALEDDSSGREQYLLVPIGDCEGSGSEAGKNSHLRGSLAVHVRLSGQQQAIMLGADVTEERVIRCRSARISRHLTSTPSTPISGRNSRTSVMDRARRATRSSSTRR